MRAPAHPRHHARARCGKRCLLLLSLLLAAAIWSALEGARWYRHKTAGLDPLAPTAISAPPQAPVAVLLFGDSRIAQWAPLPARNYPIGRRGFPGATAIQLGPRLPAILGEAQPQLVIIAAGINDAVAAALVSPPRRRQALADSIAACRAMVAASTESGARVVLLKVLPPMRPGPLRTLVYRDAVRDYVAALNVALDKIAMDANVRVVDVQELLGDRGGDIAARYRRDALHLTPAAYRTLGTLLPQQLETRD